MTTLHISPLTGEAITPIIDDLARLRITVFREWPYLYDGSMEYERHYVQKYATTQDALVVIARDGEKIIGASTALPLKEAEHELQAPFIAQGFAPQEWFYFGESILLPAYRGKGIGVTFFEAREQHSLASGYNKCCFCSVIRPDDHPQRPADYKPLDSLWNKRGFHKQPSLIPEFSWKDVGSAEETRKPLVFWTKETA